MKFISWNVNGLRACREKGFEEAFAQLDADCFCLQETKLQEGQIDLQFEGYESYWDYAEKKGYSGTAIFTRIHPLSVTYGLGIDEHDHEGRAVTLEFEDFYLVTAYVPQLTRRVCAGLDYRMTWDDAFRDYLLALDAKKPRGDVRRLERGTPRNRLEEPEVESQKCGIHRRRTCPIHSFAREWIHRYVPFFQSGPRRGLFLVELPFQSA